ncbi:MAG: DEAD/DEAH box helicase family protein [Synergistaceae bacterium]|nr:DEAD/DEAH box helicase family protein [Synergistaceae bacterium]
MQTELFPFQKKAVDELRMKTAEALGSYRRTGTPQVVSLQAPTGAGKTIIMAALIEDIYFGTDQYEEQPGAIFVWLSDSPALNEQSRQKIALKADRIRMSQCVTVEDNGFDMETLEDGRIYFLNTQKLGKAGNLGRKGDRRQYTIWETLANTAREKSDRLYFIIDEAHRGMQGIEAGRATTIMQRFLKGSPELRLSPMPLVIGVSATLERFTALVKGTSSTHHHCLITANDVRASGLLKDRIILAYPDDPARNNEMAILRAAADDWKNKCERWERYCEEQNTPQVNPVFVIQIMPGSGEELSATNLDDALAAVEERAGLRFQEHEVVHTFGSTGTITINGLRVHPVDPSQIADDRLIRVVLFKENLSTGWDCPRAETMMSFRRAEDATYIAQLLGRMIRTPLQRRIRSDDSLNDVRLYLPRFEAETVKQVINELQSSESGEIPADIEDEVIGDDRYAPWSVHSPRSAPEENPNQLPLFPTGEQPLSKGEERPARPNGERPIHPQQEPTPLFPVREQSGGKGDTEGHAEQLPLPIGEIGREEREAVIKFINEKGFLNYRVNSRRINSYLKSLLDLSGLLTRTGVCSEANAKLESDVVSMIHEHVEELRRLGKYDGLSQDVLSFKLSVRVFDVFGAAMERGRTLDLFAASDMELDRQVGIADRKMGSYGFPNKYGRLYGRPEDPMEYKVDCILFAEDDVCMAKLNRYAEETFRSLQDKYRLYLIDKSESCRKEYDDIVSNGDAVSKHSFMLPEDVRPFNDEGGTEHRDHLFADDRGIARIKLNEWERGVLEEERQARDFVCWLRNPPRGNWSLCIPCEMNGETKAMYPDFIIVRHDPTLRYVTDILEPHGNQFADNLAKAKGLAKYAAEEQSIGRIQLIHQGKDAAGVKRFQRLDLSRSATRDKVLRAQNGEELEHIFETDGFFNGWAGEQAR